MIVTELTNWDLLLDYLRVGIDRDEAKKAIESYGNARVESAVEREWKRAMKFFRAVNRTRRNKFKNDILDYDEENGCISLKEFTKFLVGVEDELRFFMINGSKTMYNVCSSVIATMYNRLGDLKVDRRLLFAKDDE